MMMLMPELADTDAVAITVADTDDANDTNAVADVDDAVANDQLCQF